jgi:hypothetical protein
MIPLSLLQRQNAETSNAILEHYKNNAAFLQLASFEGDLTVRRDQEGANLAKRANDGMGWNDVA